MAKKPLRAAGRYYAATNTKRKGATLSWQSLLIGLVIGFILGYLFFHKKQEVIARIGPSAAGHSDSGGGKIIKRPHIKSKGTTEQRAPADTVVAPAEEVEFDFYKLLPQGGAKSALPVAKNAAKMPQAKAKLVEEDDDYAQPPGGGGHANNLSTQQGQTLVSGHAASAENAGAQPEGRNAQPTGASGQDKTSSYALQVGSFERYEQADQLQAQLVLLGFEAHIKNELKNGKPLRKVWLGPFANKAEAQQMQEKLASSGIKNTLLYAR